MGAQRHTPTVFPPGKRPGTHGTGGWVCLRARLDGCIEGKNLLFNGSHVVVIVKVSNTDPLSCSLKQLPVHVETTTFFGTLLYEQIL